MRAYSEASQEALRACDLLQEWAGEGFLSEAQFERMKRETVHGLRRTNFFLRLVLFLFTLLLTIAAAVLFNMIFFAQSTSTEAVGGFLLIAAPFSYAAAELAVSRARLYRYGIEEALMVCSVGFLCTGLQFAFFSGSFHQPGLNTVQFLVAPAAGAIASLWMWHRFGLAYAFVAAMIFVYWVVRSAALSPTEQHSLLAAIYAMGLLIVAVLRKRYRLSYLDRQYSRAEALLWFGLYFTINLQLSSLSLNWFTGHDRVAGFLRPFYWATWVLTWLLPPLVLVRGLRVKDRWLIVAGLLIACLAFVTNKPYLGWQRQSWDPMIFGALLIGVALFVRRWLSRGSGEVCHGFTAKRLLGKDKTWLNHALGASGFVLPGAVVPHAPAQSSHVHFSGGDAGGGGASSDY